MNYHVYLRLDSSRDGRLSSDSLLLFSRSSSESSSDDNPATPKSGVWSLRFWNIGWLTPRLSNKRLPPGPKPLFASLLRGGADCLGVAGCGFGCGFGFVVGLPRLLVGINSGIESSDSSCCLDG